MSKTHFGTCCVCGNRTNLTFEHIPPKKANNHTQVKYISNRIDFLKNNMDFDTNSNKIKYLLGNQKGIGDYTLCSSCNNFLGANYVNDFIHVSDGLSNFFLKNKNALTSTVFNYIGVHKVSSIKQKARQTRRLIQVQTGFDNYVITST